MKEPLPFLFLLIVMFLLSCCTCAETLKEISGRKIASNLLLRSFFSFYANPVRRRTLHFFDVVPKLATQRRCHTFVSSVNPLTSFNLLPRAKHLCVSPLLSRKTTHTLSFPFSVLNSAFNTMAPEVLTIATPENSKLDTKLTTNDVVPTRVEIRRLDYRPPDFILPQVEMFMNLDKDKTEVRAILTLSRCTDNNDTPLLLYGDALELISVKVNDEVLSANDYEVKESGDLSIPAKFLPNTKGKEFVVETTVNISPAKNSRLTGLYFSSGRLCTQCEPLGFRRITFSLDRPDVLSKYKVHLTANNDTFPLLLCNGNRVFSSVQDGINKATFDDPFPKPSYLFALLAGNLSFLESDFQTMSGRNIKLRSYADEKQLHKLKWSIECLKQAFKWDEDTFGLEYDLNEFSIVAIDDFNMGAMENKGMNFFNVQCLLASKDTATDGNFENVRSVIAHEYFHNWTGNRVTCRDWFQLTLKEGLTVFREQFFCETVGSAIVERISNVNYLRSSQFREDSGPMSHPIRPDGYFEIENFYTPTVYEKGSEVIRMYKTLLGDEGFKKGMKLYFERHDGKAVTCDDFHNAMADANTFNIDLFRRWYSQSGTPVLSVKKSSYDEDKKSFSITFKQHTPPTRGQPEKQNLHIPITFGLIGKKSGTELKESEVLNLIDEEATFVFDNITEEPVPSILRGFSAPVKLEFSIPPEDLALLMRSDTDKFVRWDSGHTLLSNVILKAYNEILSGSTPNEIPAYLVNAFKMILREDNPQDFEDRDLKACMLSIPGIATLINSLEKIDPDALVTARNFVRKSLAIACEEDIVKLLKKLEEGIDESSTYTLDKVDIQRRSLRNELLLLYCASGKEEAASQAVQLYNNQICMSDKIGAIRALSLIPSASLDDLLERFYNEAAGDPVVLDKWFSLQAGLDFPDALERVKLLTKHKDFTLTNPNRLRSLLVSFVQNFRNFHLKDGSGYEFLEKMIYECDKINAYMGLTLTRAFLSFKTFEENRAAKMKAILERIYNTADISTGVFELAHKSLES